MTTLETNTAPLEAGGEGVHTPEKAVRWAIPLSLLACVLLAFFDKISIAALFSDSHFQQAMGMDFDTTRLGILMSAFLLSYGFSSVLLSGLGDRIAPLRLLTGMMMVWCVLMVMMGFTHNYTVMVTLRILLGIAEGPLFPLAFAIVRHTFPAAASGAGHHAVAARNTGRRSNWFFRCRFGCSIPLAGRAPSL
ncbi:L-galactonate transporter [Raoultella planticola]|uniref:L-galactonate transporter n=1 Tax=Raoultella planticola TaxID=575 RepID=A0A485BRG3_RAOPL|nr:L-galactonate transporter [Raoultella planticola]